MSSDIQKEFHIPHSFIRFGSRCWIYKHCYIKFEIKQNTQIAPRLTKWMKWKEIRTKQHHGDVFLKPLPGNNARADVGSRVLVLDWRNVQLTNGFTISLYVHSTHGADARMPQNLRSQYLTIRQPENNDPFRSLTRSSVTAEKQRVSCPHEAGGG